MEVFLLLCLHDLLPGLDGEERVYRGDHGDVQRDQGAVPADVGRAGAHWRWGNPADAQGRQTEVGQLD